MAPITAAEKQKLLLQQEIAKLSGAISRHSNTGSSSSSSSYHPYRGRPAPRGYPSSSASRGRGRGRGRGGSYALDLRQVNKLAASSAEPSRPSSAASVNPPSSLSIPEEGELPPSSTPPPTAAPASSSSKGAVAGPSGAGWVKGKGKGGNMSLMTVEKRDQLRTQQKQRKPKLPPQIQMLNSTAISSGDKRVVIDGVIFQFEQDGKKLTRIGEAPSSSTGGTGGVFTPTRKSLNFGGGKYKRTMKGNLILKKTGSPAKSQQLCRYFTKTGRCNFGLTCPHIHDPARVSICPRYLRGTCELGASCPLSHTPSPHNTPSCLRFQATSSCSVPDCPYPHVKVSPDAPVCEAFARGRWCPKEAGECEELHVWECPEFRSKGTCPKGGKCGLRHVVRAENGRRAAAQSAISSSENAGGTTSGEGAITIDTIGEDVPAGGIEEQDDFVQFDQGSPEAVFSAEEDENGEGEEDDEEEEDGAESESEVDEDEDEDEDEEDDGVSAGAESDEEETMSGTGLDSESAEGDDDVERGQPICGGNVGNRDESTEDAAAGKKGKQILAQSQAQAQVDAPLSAVPPHIPSDAMDTDEVDEDAVLSVVF
ncbi:hypothetical protein I317_01656 [Kwoniella heveanensis CBS 569]|nr:hypothetical protein I317_01656 [Kwoniella heveanensis CBS 569]